MMKGLQRWAVPVILCFGIATALPAQQPVKTTKDRPTQIYKQPPVEIKTPVKVKVPPKQKEDIVPKKEALQVEPPRALTLDLEALNQPLLVSQKYTRTLHDNSLYIDERGMYEMAYDIVKKQDGRYALVYLASSENPAMRNKGVLFMLNSNLSQHGSPMVVTMPDETVIDIRIKEFPGGMLSIPYVCCDSRSDEIKGNGEVERDYDVQALKHTQVNANGGVTNRAVDPDVGSFDLVDFFKNYAGGDISVLYNLDGKGKIGLADSYFGNYTMTCTLKPLPRTETVFYGSPPNTVRPDIVSASFESDNFLIYTNARLQAPVWDLGSEGLISGRALRPAWPLLGVNSYAVSNSDGGQCSYDNDPYTVYSDAALDLDKVIDAFVLGDGKLGVLEEGSSFTYFNIFDSTLGRLHQHAGLFEDIEEGSLRIMELGNSRILFFYKTTTGTGYSSSDTDQYRATVYDWNIHDILWTGSEVLWEEPHSSWKRYKLVRADDNRLIAVTFAEEDGKHLNHQALEYRIITLNLDE